MHARSHALCVMLAAFAAPVALASLALPAPPVTVGGTIKEISAGGAELTLLVGTDYTKEQVLRVTPKTKITLDGKVVKVGELEHGSRVTVSYEKETNEATSIRATSKPAAAARPPASRAAAQDRPAQAVAKQPQAGGKAAASSVDWPQWRGPERSGISHETGLLKSWPKDGPALVWKTSGLGGGYSSPSVAAGRVYGMGYRGDDEVVWALDAATGKEIWATRIAKANRGVGYGEGSRSTPTLDAELLYVLGVSGDLVCLELAGGKERWRKNLVSDFGGSIPGWGYTESPLVDDNKVICTPGGPKGTLVALDKKSGNVAWQSKDYTDAAAYSSVMPDDVAGKHQYVQMTGSSVAGVAAQDGKLLWRYARSGPTAAVPTPVVHNNFVYATSGYGAGCHLVRLVPHGNEIKPEEVYANKVMVNHHGGVVLVNDHLYGYSDGKGWVCQEFKTGKMVWNDKDKLGKGAVTYADGHLYARSEGGPVALIEATPRGYVEKGRLSQPDRSSQQAWPHPVIAGGKLYLRDQDILLCYDVREGGQKASRRDPSNGQNVAER